MVNSDDCASRASEKMVPISTAIGNSSYSRPGTL
jgi:hypothetical protein